MEWRLEPELAVDTCTEDIVRKIQRRLRESPYYDLRRITCDVRGSSLTLFGRIPVYLQEDVTRTVTDVLTQADTRQTESPFDWSKN